MLFPTTLRFAPALRAAAVGVIAQLLAATLACAAPPQARPDASRQGEPDAQVAAVEEHEPRAAGSPSSPGTRARPVFVCEEAGIPVFADRPCGRALELRSVSFAAAPAGESVSTVPPVPRASTKPRPQPVGAAPPRDATAQRCATLRRQLEETDDRMRTGYSSREAARLWARWRDLKTRLRAERC